MWALKDNFQSKTKLKTNKEKDESVVTLPLIKHMCHEIWYLMKHQFGPKSFLPDSIELEQKLQEKLNEKEQGNKIETNPEARRNSRRVATRSPRSITITQPQLRRPTRLSVYSRKK